MKKILFAVIMFLMMTAAAGAEVTGSWMWVHGTEINSAELHADGTVYIGGKYFGTWEKTDRVIIVWTTFFGEPFQYFTGITDDNERQIIGDGITLLKK